MLSLFEQLQNGTLSPNSFVLSHATQRVFNLELSNGKDFEEMTVGGVNCLDIEQVDQRYLLSGTNTSGIQIFDLHSYTGKTPYTYKALCSVDRSSRYSHAFSVDTVQWYPFDTGMFTTSSMDSTLKMWDTNTMKSAATVPMRGKVYRHHLSPVATNHSLIAAGMSYPHVVLIDMKSGSKCHELYGHKGEVLSVRWSPSCEYLLASGGSDNKIYFWDIRSAKGFLSTLDQHNGEEVSAVKGNVSAHSGKINSLCFSSDGLYLLSWGTDHHMRLWDVAKSRNTLVNYGKIANRNYKYVQMDLCYDAAVPTIFVPSDSKLLVYDIFRGNRIGVLVGHFNRVNCCVFRACCHELYSGGYDHKIHIWTADVEQEMADSDDVIKKASSHDHWSD